jgi:hypothetical protein
MREIPIALQTLFCKKGSEKDFDYNKLKILRGKKIFPLLCSSFFVFGLSNYSFFLIIL